MDTSTTQTVVVAKKAVDKARALSFCQGYRSDRRVIDAIRQGLKSEEIKSIEDYLDGLRERVIAFFQEADDLTVNGRGYTPPAEWGIGSNSLAEIAEAILGQRTTDGKLRTAAAKVGKVG